MGAGLVPRRVCRALRHNTARTAPRVQRVRTYVLRPFKFGLGLVGWRIEPSRLRREYRAFA